MSLNDIQTCTDRCAVKDAAMTEQTDPDFVAAAEASKQAAMQQHFLNRIIAFCNETNTSSAQAVQTQLKLPINNLITSSVLDTWEANLIAKGYTVVRDTYDFTISLM